MNFQTGGAGPQSERSLAHGDAQQRVERQRDGRTDEQPGSGRTGACARWSAVL